MTARPPAFSTQAAITSESVATTTGPSCAACARRMTWMIIGSPAMSASALLGSRVEAKRAGMRITMSAIGAFSGKMGTRFSARAAPREEASLPGRLAIAVPKLAWMGRLIRVARGEANRLFVRRRIRGDPPGRFASDLKAMDSFELNKILGAILGTCLGVLSINIAAGAIFAPGKPAKPGYDIVVPEQKPGGGTAAPQQEQQQPIEQLLANADPSRGENSAKK